MTAKDKPPYQLEASLRDSSYRHVTDSFMDDFSRRIEHEYPYITGSKIRIILTATSFSCHPAFPGATKHHRASKYGRTGRKPRNSGE